MTVLEEKFLLTRAKAQDLYGVKTLNFWGAQFSDVSLLKNVPNAEIINASANKIEGLEAFACCTKLQELYLRSNNIKNIKEVLYLHGLKNLRYLWLSGNPFCDDLTEHQYRSAVLKVLPHLKKLDNTTVTAEELKQALRSGYDINRSSQTSSSDNSFTGEVFPSDSPLAANSFPISSSEQYETLHLPMPEEEGFKTCMEMDQKFADQDTKEPIVVDVDKDIEKKEVFKVDVDKSFDVQVHEPSIKIGNDASIEKADDLCHSKASVPCTTKVYEPCGAKVDEPIAQFTEASFSKDVEKCDKDCNRTKQLQNFFSENSIVVTKHNEDQNLERKDSFEIGEFKDSVTKSEDVISCVKAEEISQEAGKKFKEIETEDDDDDTELNEVNKLRIGSDSKSLTPARFFSATPSKLTKTKKKPKRKSNIMTATLALLEELDEDSLYRVQEKVEELIQEKTKPVLSLRSSASSESLQSEEEEVSLLID